MAEKAPITEFVPEILRRNPLQDPSVLTSLLPRYLPEEMGLDEAISFIQGAVFHHHTIQGKYDHVDADGNERQYTSRVFPAKVDSVEILERKGETGWVLGHKARIHLLATGTGGKEESQHIDTGWIDYKGFDAESVAWETALARTIRSVAEESVGKDVFVRKVVVEGDDIQTKYGNKVRYCADLRLAQQRQGGRESDSDAADDSPTALQRLRKSANLLDPRSELTEEDLELLAEIVEQDPSRKAAVRKVADYLSVEPDDMDVPDGLEGRPAESLDWLITLVLENLED